MKKYTPKFNTEIDPAAAHPIGVAATVDGTEPEQDLKPVTKKGSKRAGLNTVEADGDLVDIWERRILNPNSRKVPVIHIKTPGMHLRWINCAAPGRYHRARYEQGWIPVTRLELVDEREIYGVSYSPEGYVCRGEKLQEMLMKMPEAVYKQIVKRRNEENQKSVGRMKDHLKSAGSKHFGEKYSGSAGEQAADAVDTFKGDIKFGKETVGSESMLD